MEKIIHHIKKIRRQPEHVRRSVLYIFTVIFAIILFLLWIYSLGTKVTSQGTSTRINQELKPFSILKDNITEQYNNISAPSSNTMEQAQ